jgi:probable HAF family extracellular repeat protein
MRVIGVGACTVSALAACTGRAPQPVAVVQPYQIKRRPFGKATLMLVALILVLNPGSSRAACKTSSPCATTPMDLGTLGGDAGTSVINSEAAAVTDNGLVVGTAVNPDNLRRAFLWQNGVMVDLGTLGGVESYAFDVSNNGQVVVGASLTTSGNNHAFLWKSSKGMVDLGTLGGSGSVAWAVNSNGSVAVGESYTASSATHAFRWTKVERNDRPRNSWRRFCPCLGCQQQWRRGGW